MPRRGQADPGRRAITNPLLEIAFRTGVVYLALLLGLRLTGKRQAGQMTPFGFLLLLLLANSVQHARTRPDTAPAAGVVAAATLVAVNLAAAWAVRRSSRTKRGCE